MQMGRLSPRGWEGQELTPFGRVSWQQILSWMLGLLTCKAGLPSHCFLPMALVYHSVKSKIVFVPL